MGAVRAKTLGRLTAGKIDFGAISPGGQRQFGGTTGLAGRLGKREKEHTWPVESTDLRYPSQQLP